MRKAVRLVNVLIVPEPNNAIKIVFMVLKQIYSVALFVNVVVIHEIQLIFKISANNLEMKEKNREKLDEKNNCFTYSSETKKLIERDNGEWWTDNHCRQCFCQNKKVFFLILICV